MRGARSSKAPDEVVMYGLRIPKGQLDQLRLIAHAEHRTLVQKLRVMIEREIADTEEDKAA